MPLNGFVFVCLGVDEKVKDVVFLVGGSSVYHYNTAMQLLPKIAQGQQTSDTLFALIRYARAASLEIPFQMKDNFTRNIADIYWTGKGDTLKDGLYLVSTVFVDYGRPHSERVLVVFVSDDDETPSSKLIKSNMNLTKNGIKVVPVVIGEPRKDNKLMEIHPKKKMPLAIKPGDDPKDGSDKISEIVFKGVYILVP